MRNQEHASAVVPYFVARLSAMPVEAIAALSAPRLTAASERAETLARRIAGEREDLSQRLHDEIGAQHDRPTRNRLLELRRDLYNGRSVTDEQLAVVRDLAPETQRAVASFRALLADRDAATNAVRAEYTGALSDNRHAMRAALCDDGFRNGLLLSSSTLARNVERYLGAASVDISSRDEQIERGLLRYLTRTTVKATPFATLCTIVLGRLADSSPGAAVLTVNGQLNTRRSVVQLNKRIHLALWERMKRCESVRRSLLVERNPTTRQADDHWTFLGRRNGREEIEQVACAPLADHALALLARSPMTLDALRNRVSVTNTAQSTERDATRALDAMLDIGLLRFRNPVPDGTANWDAPFGALLAGVDDDDARIAHALVVELRQLVDRYATAALCDRGALVEAMRGTADRGFAALGLEARRLVGGVVFEDATADATLVVSRSAGVDAALRCAAEWIAAVALVAPWRAEQATMRHFFDACCGPEAGAVPLLLFHEVFEREHLLAHRDREERVWRGAADAEDVALVANPFQLDIVRRLRAASDRVMECLWSSWVATPDALEVDLSPEVLADALADLGVASSSYSSASLFGQIIAMDGDDHSVRIISAKDHYPIGFGKFSSRFLHVMPDWMQRTILSDNVRHAGNDVILAELCADAFFNANLHPRILPAEISCPVVDGDGRSDRLSVTDLDVIRDPSDAHALQLIHRSSGKRVIPVDVGFVSLRRRPLLYQLMARFCPAGDAYAPLPELLADVEPGDDALVRYRPRFTYADRVVLSRRRWMVPGALLPVRAMGEPDLDYFLRVRRWRTANGIDEQVFAIVHPEPGADTDGDEGRSRDWRKPQFIDFTSPLLVALFEKLPGGLSHFTLELQERYPDAASLPAFAGQHYASELVLQFDAEPTIRDAPR